MTTTAEAHLGDVLWGGAAAVGALAGEEAKAAAGRLRLPQGRKTCVVLADGLGWHNLAARADHAPFLTARLAEQDQDRAPVNRLRAALPTTTATNLAYLGTGQRGGATGMLGYTVRRDRASRGLLNMISWRGGADPLRWQRRRTVFEHIVAGGAGAVSIGPWRFEGSGLTVAALRGAEFIPAESLPARVDAALHALRDPQVSVVYLYWGEVDSVGHQLGWTSAAWADELRHLDTQISDLARRLPQAVNLLVTADHGMVDIADTPMSGGQGRIDAATDPDLSRDVSLIGGEPRFSHVYTSQPEQVAERWRRRLADQALVLSRAEAIGADWFGPVAAEFTEVIGDVVVAATSPVAIMNSAMQPPEAMALLGMHGSVTDQEREVPLVAVQG